MRAKWIKCIFDQTLQVALCRAVQVQTGQQGKVEKTECRDRTTGAMLHVTQNGLHILLSGTLNYLGSKQMALATCGRTTKSTCISDTSTIVPPCDVCGKTFAGRVGRHNQIVADRLCHSDRGLAFVPQAARFGDLQEYSRRLSQSVRAFRSHGKRQ